MLTMKAVRLSHLSRGAALPRSLGTATASRLRLEDPIEFALMRSRGVRALMEVHEAHSKDFEGMHIASLWSRMEKWTGSSHGGHLMSDAGDTLVAHSIELIGNGALSSAHLIQVARGAVTAGRTDPALLDAIVAHADIARVPPHALSDISWALATAGYTSQAFFDVLATSAARQVDQLDEFHLARVAAAHASVGHTAPSLFDAIATAATRLYATEQGHLRKPPVEAMPDLAWAFATAGQEAPRLFDAIATSAAPRVRELQPHALARLAWAFASAGHAAPVLFDGIGRRARAVARGMPLHDLARTAWAFATAGHADHNTTPALFASLADAFLARQSEWTMHSLADFAWACAYLDHRDPRLFDAIAAAAAPRVRELQPHALARLAWAFAAADHAAPVLFDSAFTAACDEAACGREGACPLSPEHLCQLHAWQLWHCEETSELEQHAWTSPDLSARCRRAFEAAASAAEDEHTDQLRRELVTVLETLPGCTLRREAVVTASGYRLAHVVHWDVPNVPNAEIGVEIAGPPRYAGTTPTGVTQLRLRQLRSLDDWLVLSVPHWEWAALEGDAQRQHSFLEEQLNLVALDGRDPYAHLVAPLYELRLDI